MMFHCAASVRRLWKGWQPPPIKTCSCPLKWPQFVRRVFRLLRRRRSCLCVTNTKTVRLRNASLGEAVPNTVDHQDENKESVQLAYRHQLYSSYWQVFPPIYIKGQGQEHSQNPI